MSTTVDELIKLLDTEGNRYGGATGKPRELNISINGNFCGSIESAKLDGFGDGLVTDVTLEIEAPKMREYYDKEIRDKAIEEFAEAINNKISEFVLQHKDNLDFASGIAVSWNIVDEIAEQLERIVRE